MSTHTPQIFQTSSSARWKRVKGGFRVFFFLGVLLAGSLVFAIRKGLAPAKTRFNDIDPNERYKKILNPKNGFVLSNYANKEYSGFRQYIDDKIKYDRYKKAPKADTLHGFPCPIRAAFYVAWDAQARRSLKANISNLNMVLPEWFFIDPSADTLRADIDPRGLALMRGSGVRVVPMLTNYVTNGFDGDALHRILSNPAKRRKLIEALAQILEREKFTGVNVDFEELKEKTNEPLVEFQKELYDRLHPGGYMVTQDVMVFNEDFNYRELARYNDYLFVMAYDQHSSETKPGPISEQKWIESAIDHIAKEVPTEKLVLAIAGYGYDWAKDSQGVEVTFQEALAIARENPEAVVDFDNNNYNVKFDYTDDNEVAHQVYFADAATNFNSLRYATESGMSGVVIWRLGSEDSRIWKFYNKDMTRAGLAHFDFNDFAHIEASNSVDFEGEGEIIEVKSMPKMGRITPEVDSTELLITEEKYDSLPSMFVIQKYGKAGKKMVLSFDDGPTAEYTPRILDILKNENVPASFFIVGVNAEQNIPIVRREYKEGYEIGNHSFTHPNIAEVSESRAFLELKLTRLLIECVTGHSTLMFRPPYNADSEPETMQELLPVARSKEDNYITVEENIDPMDWEENVTADSIFERVARSKESGNILLLHDAGGRSREATVQALPRIIQYLKKEGYTFTTVADLLGKKKDDLMPAVPKGEAYLIQTDYLIAEVVYWLSHTLFSLFLLAIFLSVGRIIFMSVLATLQYLQDRKFKNSALAPTVPSAISTNGAYPPVSIIVPAYNEEINIIGSINNLLKADYPNLRIIIIDDGSKDKTFDRANSAFRDNPKIELYTKQNGGKASALNYGISKTDSEIVVCIDADTKLLPDAVSKLVRHFTNEEVGAVAGNVKVGNEVNLMTNWQSIEYIGSQNFDRRAFAYLNCITVVPGAIGAFRKSAIDDAGGFTTDTLAEDCDLTIRILRAGYLIENDHDAIAMTEAPETLRQFLRQRFRWSFGVMQTFWKNRDALFNSEYGSLGWVALPNMLIFQFLIPSIAPIADFLMVVGLFIGNAGVILPYYLVFMLVDAAVAVVAFAFEEKANFWKLLWLIPQRLVWRQLMYYILFKSFLRAIKGELQQWGVLKRTGNVKEIVPTH